MLVTRSSSFLSALRSFLSHPRRLRAPRVYANRAAAVVSRNPALSTQHAASFADSARPLALRTQLFTLEALESRLLLSATPAGTASLEVPDTGAEVAGADRHELVVIDSAVQDAGQLIQGLGPGREVLILKGDQDGIVQISAALATRQDLNAIHVVTHGSDRLIKLGDTWLTSDSITSVAEQIHSWSASLAAGADLLFYSCDLARGDAGRSLLTTIHELTGADVAASTNDTGHGHYGADWTLEYQLGAIDSTALLSQSVQEDWTGLLATFTVTTTADAGAGSLRQAILDANAASGLDTIAFNITGSGVHTIALTSALPTITSAVIIDGYTQAGTNVNILDTGSNAELRIELNGANAGPGNGIVLNTDNSIVRGLVINGFNGQGVVITGSTNVLEGNFIGTNAAGTASVANGSSGVRISAGTGNLIGGTTVSARNVISGNGSDGILIQNAGVGGNLVQGNLIGTNAAGTAAVANARHGIFLFDGAFTNMIGGTIVGAGNVISGNTSTGISISGAGTTGNQILGNFIGTNAAGTSALANGTDGITIQAGASNNTIGGTTVPTRNLISGNTSIGVLIQGVGSTNNIVQGNYIGVNAAGTGPVGNGVHGVRIVSGANNNIIGGPDGTTPGGPSTGASNVISANGSDGIDIRTVGNIVAGNYIGTNAAGTGALANGRHGIAISASNNTIGGPTVAHRNVIAGNSGIGVTVNAVGSASADGNIIQGNYIGVAADGTIALGNSGVDSVGVRVQSSNVVGGTSSNTQILGNVIAGNAGTGLNSGAGILVDDGTNGSNMPTGTVIKGNFIGTNATGTAAFTEQRVGLKLNDAANSVIGGVTVADRNVISGNAGNGIEITGNGSTGNLVQGNYIGTNAAGTSALANGANGVIVQNGASNNTIGGTVVGAGNVISGNDLHGVFVAAGVGTNNTIQGNIIGLDKNGTGALGNVGSGVVVMSGFDTLIGGTTASARNIISANSFGISLSQSGSNYRTVVQGNYIGTDITGLVARGNSTGVWVGSSPGTRIGGVTASPGTGAGNVISGNGSAISIDAISSPVINGLYNSVVEGNLIGLTADGLAALPNSSGIGISNADNLIGGTAVGSRNVISGNVGSGIVVSGSAASGNVIQGNYIGTNTVGSAALPNLDAGVLIQNAATTNSIGGTVASARNVISGNGNPGIYLTGAGTNGNIVEGNLIGLNAAGTGVLPNAAGGILIAAGASNNRIGGTGSGSRNVVSGNASAGVIIHGAGTSGNLVQGNYVGTDQAGLSAMPNTTFGVRISNGASSNVIGGLVVGARNVISGNINDGVLITDVGSSSNLVQGNYIGTASTGTSALPNGNSLNGSGGIQITAGASGNVIGGTTAESQNVIAFNGGAGVRIESNASTGNRVQGNSMFSNGGLGIDLVGTAGAIEAIDDDDLDVGPNNLQNVPQLTLVTTSFGTTVTGVLDSTPNTAFTVELFMNATGSLALAEAQTFLTRFNVTTDANGLATFQQPLGSSVPIGEVVTAIATDPNGNTSEISTGKVVGVPAFPLNATLTGLGSGRVFSGPTGIDSRPVLGPADLSEVYPINTLVMLTAIPDAGSFFLKWTGDGIDNASPTLLVPMDQARTITANFGITATEPVAPVPTGNQAASLWLQSVTNTWERPFIPQGRTLLGYLVRVSLEDGVFTDPPIFVPATETSLTLVNRPIAPHFFTVSSLTTVSTTTPGAGLQSSALIEPAAANGAADFYAIQRGGQFQTVPTTGVLANDIGVNLVAGFATQPLHGTLVFNPDGTFLYHHNGDAAASDSFTYRVDEGTVTATSPLVAVTITIAQESGRSQTASVTPNAGLQGWTVQDESTNGGPSLWNGIESPTYGQTALIGDSAVSVIKPGTDLIQNDGLPDGRIDYTLTFTIKSDANGAVGVMFRYLNAQNYYRFSMFNGEGGQEVYRRLIKVTQGVATTLWEQSATNPGLSTAQWQQLTGPAYVQGRHYTLTIKADDLPQALPTDPVQTDLIVRVQDSLSGQFVVDRAMTDTQSLTAPLRTNGLALYSSRNSGSTYNLLGITGLDNSSERALEVGQNGSGVGIVRGTVVDITQPGGIREVLLTPGSPVTSLAPNTIVTLTATPQVGGSFGGWTGAVTVPNLNTPHIAQVTLDQVIGQTKLVTATFNGVPVSPFTFDVNGDGLATPQDAIVILRYLSLVSGPALTAGVVTGGTRTDPVAIKEFLDKAKDTMLDVNQDGQATPQDAIVILRHLSLVSGPALTAGVVTGGTQTDPAAIKTYLNRYTPGALLASATVSSDSVPATSQVSPSVEAASVLPSPVSIPQPTILSAQGPMLDTSDAIAATQLSITSVSAKPWVAEFLGIQEDDDVLVRL